MTDLSLQSGSQLLIRQTRSIPVIINHNPTLRRELINILQIQRRSLHITIARALPERIDHALNPFRVDVQFCCATIPFFDEPAMTSTATSRILEISGATLLPCFHRRCDDSSYVIHIGAPLKNFPSDSPAKDTTRLMKILEDYIRESPEQYGWMHQRFKNRPEIYPDIYAPTKSA